MVKIYSLTHPSSTRLYIGKTVQTLGNRLSGHMREARQSEAHNRRLNWIRSLVKNGLKPIISLIVEVYDDKWIEEEKYHIALGWKEHPNDMLNDPRFIGGDGSPAGIKHSKESVLKRSGENAPQSKITYIIANEIREKYSTGNYKHFDLSKEYNISKTMIGNIIRNEYWIDTENKYEQKLFGRKLDNKQLEEIASRINSGEYIKDLAKEFGISRNNLWSNLNGKINGTIRLEYKTNASINNLKPRKIKLNDEYKSEVIIKYSNNDISERNLAKEYKVSRTCIANILKEYKRKRSVS